MPEPDIKSSISSGIYQQLNGKNFTLLGYENKINGKKAYISTFQGIGTNFKDDFMCIWDVKSGCNYNSKGLTNQNLRIRAKLGEKSSAIQIRYSPLSVDIPVNKNTNIYLNPHYSGQMDFRKHKWTNSIGAFAGISTKLNTKATLSLEAQRYNLQNIKQNNLENWGINAILSYKL